MNARAVPSSLIQPVDARIPAIFRIAIGLVACLDFADRLRDAFTFYSSQGLLAPDAAMPGANALPLWMLGAAPSPARVTIFFVLGFVVLTAFTLGYRTRLATFLSWVIIFAIQMRNRTICDGGDTVLRILFFWSLFVDLGARFSLDTWLGRRPPQATVAGLPVRLLRLQIALIYLAAGLSKSGPSWMDGSAVYYSVQSLDFGRPAGVRLAAHLALARAMTFGTLAIEISFAPLVLLPLRTTAARALGLVLGLALHLGIALTMRVGIFSWVLPASYTILLSPRWLDAARAWIGAARPAARVPEPDHTPSTTANRRSTRLAHRLSWLLWGALGLQIAAVTCQLVLGRDGGRWLPVVVYRELALLGIGQTWTMFAPDPPRRVTRFTAAGVLTDGTPIDVLAHVTPKLMPDRGVVYSRWYKYRSDLAQTIPNDLAVFGHYVCRRYNGETSGAKMQRFSLTLYWRDLPPPGQRSASAWEHTDVLQQPCL